MSTRGLLRTIAASQRKAERESLKKKRELERRLKQVEKLQEIEQVAYEVEVFENHIDLITSIHKDCSDSWDWEKIRKSKSPTEPKKPDHHEKSAQSNLEMYKPKFFDKLLNRDSPKRIELSLKISEGKKRDEAEYNEAYKKYKLEYANWESMTNLAEKIVNRDEKAYVDAIYQADPFNEINQLGSEINFFVKWNNLIEARINVNSDKVIPRKVKTQLKSGKLSEKTMPKTRFYELYQDYVCGVVLRIARELFALLPIDISIVTAFGRLLNTSTGFMEAQPILSVIIPRDTLIKLNFQRLDASDSMNNFIHDMKFLKTKGFQPVDILSPSDIKPL
jgi:hypothetical protein